MSVLESFFPKDRQVRSRCRSIGRTSSWAPSLAASASSSRPERSDAAQRERSGGGYSRLGRLDGLWLSAAAAAVVSTWMRKMGTIAVVFSVLLFMVYEHTVLNFTMR